MFTKHLIHLIVYHLIVTKYFFKYNDVWLLKPIPFLYELFIDFFFQVQNNLILYNYINCLLDRFNQQISQSY
jgi:hypothetical protein